MQNRKRIALIGIGLIGGSLALKLHEKKISSELFAVDRSEEHLQQALELELVDQTLTLNQAIEQADVLILCIPVNEIVTLLPEILNKIKPHQMVLDVGSTKTLVSKAIENHSNKRRFLGTHPMWGTEYSGPKAAMRDAFEGRTVVLCDTEDADQDVVDFSEMMYKKIGMKILRMNALEHDVHTAYISHISHITSFALANTVLQKEKKSKTIFALASSGFDSTVRLAKSNAAMWTPIFLQNKENILDVLSEHIEQLLRFKKSIENDSSEELHLLIHEANQIKKVLK